MRIESCDESSVHDLSAHTGETGLMSRYMYILHTVPPLGIDTYIILSRYLVMFANRLELHFRRERYVPIDKTTRNPRF